MSTNSSVALQVERSSARAAQTLVLENAAEELFFAVVGHVGSGTTEIAKALVRVLKQAEYDAEALKASHEIERWAKANKGTHPSGPSLKRAESLQDLGDEMRSRGDHAAVAAAMIGAIRETRAGKKKEALTAGAPVVPDGNRRAYVLDSVRHPAEIELLRRVYGTAFSLVGVVCQEDTRASRLRDKYGDASQDDIRTFMARDSKAPEKYGQRVSDAFYMADYFVDNTPNRWLERKAPNVDWTIPEQLSRLVKIIQRRDVQHPYIAETAMYIAQGAQFRSSCLSRQVGAALLSKDKEVIAVGSNDVPHAGGGLCGPGWAAPDDNVNDGRCVHGKGCMSTDELAELAGDVAADLIRDRAVNAATDETDLAAKLRKTRIREIIEYSRAVHAEMEALLSAARKGISTKGTRMFVTTYPCHYCARHLVSAGVDEVQYIEPYPKSRARRMHGDAITSETTNWKPPSDGGNKVLFRPFTGVAPRLYARAFTKDRDLKDDTTGAVTFGLPTWGTSWYIARASYAEMEAKISGNR